MSDPFRPPPGAKVKETIIPKDCCLCDVCNKRLTDSKFIATADCEWYEGYLYCMDCKKEYKPETDLKLIARITKGEDISNTELARPMVFTTW